METHSTALSRVNQGRKNMMVAVRVRPLSDRETNSGVHSCCQVLQGGRTVTIEKAQSAKYLRSQKGSLHEYTFDAAFGSTSTQQEIYQATTKPFMKQVIDGFNVTVFAYGATGSGKV